MKKHCIAFIFLICLVFTLAGCSKASPEVAADREIIQQSDDEKVLSETASAKEAANRAVTDNSVKESSTDVEPKELNSEELLTEVTAVFQGLEDNHTAIFSFNDVEKTFYFEAPGVKNVFAEAVTDSSYTFSYYFDSSLGLNVIYEITEK